MPIEIKELHIRVTVNAPANDQGVVRPAAAEQSFKKDEIVAECIEQVLQIIQGKNDR